VGKRLDVTGKKFGCFTAISKGDSIKLNYGTVGTWNVKCDCGKEKNIRAQQLITRNHVSCGAGCSLRHDAIIEVNCEKCKSPYSIRRDSLTKAKKNSNKRICRQCLVKAATLSIVGKPAPNRLPYGISAFNTLYGNYKRSATSRKFDFEISKDRFKELTLLNCHYCGSLPNTSIIHRNAAIKGHDSGAYIYNGVDRVDAKKGYIEGNVVPCCPLCNYMKSDFPVSDFLSHVIKISKYQN
jgi:hypothetical protein